MELNKLLSCSEQDFIQFTGCVGKDGDGRGDEDDSDLGDEPGCVCKRSLHSGKRPGGARRACRLSLTVVNRRHPEGSNPDDMSG